MSDQQLALVSSIIRDVPATAICILFVYQVNRTFTQVLKSLEPLILAIAERCIGDEPNR